MSLKHALSLLLLLSLALPACSSRHAAPHEGASVYGEDDPYAGDRPASRHARSGKRRDAAPRREVVNGKKETGGVTGRAHSAIGTPYVPGGRNPGGFDCSGLVQWAYKGAGVTLPRTAQEQSRVGYAVTDRSKMRAGDIVSFRRRDGGYHTGIYLGGGRFIHAPRPNAKVRVESLDTDFFRKTFIGARRVDMGKGDPAALAQARERDARARAASAKGQGGQGGQGRADGAPGARRNKGQPAAAAQEAQLRGKPGKTSPAGGQPQDGRSGRAASKERRPASEQGGAKTADAKPATPKVQPKAAPRPQQAPQAPKPAAKQPTQAPLRANASTKPAGQKGTMQAPTATQRQARDKPASHRATAGPSAPVRSGDKVQKPERQEKVQIQVRPMGRRTTAPE